MFLQKKHYLKRIIDCIIHSQLTHRKCVDIKQGVINRIQAHKEIPEEVRNKYNHRYEMKKFYKKRIPWSQYEEKDSHFLQDKEEREKEIQERREHKREREREKYNDDINNGYNIILPETKTDLIWALIKTIFVFDVFVHFLTETVLN